MRILVCGGRNYADRARVFGVLDAIGADIITHIIQGGADGADALAREWALARCVPLTTYPANWSKYGKRAGPIRNHQMAKEERARKTLHGATVRVLAFPGGRGTRHMANLAREVGLSVTEVE